MADRRDDLDSWLEGRVDPLPPPPGTFELIKRRARRRKYRRLAVTAGAAAVVVAAAVTVPQVINLPVLNPTTANQAAANGRSSSAKPSVLPSASSSSAEATLSAPPALAPPNFHPTSVTFIGTESGWVIGQAGTPGHCATQYCTSVAFTSDAGKLWFGSPAPLTGPADGATGVSQIRFLNPSDGWAFGPELFATHDGGQTWTRVETYGLRVTDLEAVGSRAFALFASCTGTGADFASRCTSYTLYSSPDSADDWTPLGTATSNLTTGGHGGAAAIVLTGTTGFLVAPNGQLYAGPVDGTGPWPVKGRLPCRPGTAQPDGQPAGTLLGAVDASSLVLACTPAADSGGAQKKLIFTSADGGSTWQQTALPPFDGVATSVAGSPAGNLLLGSTTGISVLPTGGTEWQRASVADEPAGGFSFVGMTTATQGVAVPANPKAGAVWFTYDGGMTWVRSRIS